MAALTAFVSRTARKLARPAAGLVLGVGLMSPLPALAFEPTDFLTVKYVFRAVGITVGEAKLTASMDADGRYMATSKMKTAGLAEVFYKSRYDILATGAHSPEPLANGLKVLPSRYDSDFSGSSGDKLSTLLYSADGDPAPVVADPPYGKVQMKHPVPEADQREAVDPMSAWVHMIMGASASETDPCGRSIPIFDGRRRYNLKIETVGGEMLDLNRDDWDYEGPATRCKMLYEPVSGFKPSDDNADDGLPVPPLEIWVAKLTSKDGGRSFHVPVKLRAETPLGYVVMMAEDVNFKPVRDPRLTKDGKDEDE